MPSTKTRSAQQRHSFRARNSVSGLVDAKCNRFSIEPLEDRRLLTTATITEVPLDLGALVFNGDADLGYEGSFLATSSPAGNGPTPAQIRTVYGYNSIPPLFGSITPDGNGETIAIVVAYDYPNIDDVLDAFDRSAYWSSPIPDAPSFQVVKLGGDLVQPDPLIGVSTLNWAGETALDVEWAHAIAPGANLVLIEVPNESYLFEGVRYAVRHTDASVISMSWGYKEGIDIFASDEAVVESVFNDPLAKRNIAFVAASGDSGAIPSYPSTSPNVLSVGGTNLTLNTNGTRASETGWSLSGGGVSLYQSQPTFQNGVVNAFSTTKRTTPDVAIIGGTDVPVYDALNFGTITPWTSLHGTSLSAPIWAGTVAIADQHGLFDLVTGFDTTGTVTHASLQQQLYSLSSSDFFDITSGNNGTSAGSGYDLVTGRGVPIASALIPDLWSDDGFYLTLPAGGGNYTLKVASGVVEVSNDSNGSIVGGVTRPLTQTSIISIGADVGAVVTLDPSADGIPLYFGGLGTLNIRATTSGVNTRVIPSGGSSFTPNVVNVGSTNNTLGGILGPLSIFGDNFYGATSVSLNDSGNPNTTNYFVRPAVFASGTAIEVVGAPAPIYTHGLTFQMGPSAAFAAFSFYIGSNSQDTVTLSGSPDGDTLGGSLLPFIQAQNGGQSVFVGGGQLDLISGTVYVVGGSLVIDDTLASDPKYYRVTSSGVSRYANYNQFQQNPLYSQPSIFYFSLAHLTVRGGTSPSDRMDLISTPAPTTLFLNGKLKPIALAADLQGAVNAAPNSGVLTIDDGDYATASAQYTVSSSSFTRDGLTLSYDSATPLSIQMGTASSDTLTLTSLAALQSLTILNGAAGQSIHVNGAIAFRVDSAFDSGTQFSQIKVIGPVNLTGASLTTSLTSGYTPTLGQQFTVVDNDGSDAITGTFSGLAQGAVITIGGSTYTITYTGGTGNDVVLKRENLSSVLGRNLFYNQSGTSTRYDHNDAAINSFDDNAIAPDKAAYLSGSGPATFANVSSYDKGINGIMIDLAGPGFHQSITASDFIFRAGNNNSPSTWATATSPTSISVRAGSGVSGSDRVEIIWTSGAPTKQWLEIIALVTDNTGLPQLAGYPTGQGDVFFFGNAVGDSGEGDSTVNATVNSIDEGGARNNPGSNVPLTNIYDYNRSSNVNAVDEGIARDNVTNGSTVTKYLNLASPPAAPQGDGGGGGAGVASALTAMSSTTPALAGEPAAQSSRSGLNDNSAGSDPLGSAIATHLLHWARGNTPRAWAVLHAVQAETDSVGVDDELLAVLAAGWDLSP